MDKAYSRINWQNEPSIATPINDVNLNRMDNALNVIDNRVVNFDTTKANQSDMLLAVKTIAYNDATGVFTITFFNGNSVTVDTNLEKLAVNFDYDDDPTSSHYQQLVITLDDGTIKYVDLSALITQYEFVDSSIIDFTIDSNGRISADIINGSITAEKFSPTYLADCEAAQAAAELAQSNAESAQADAEAAQTAAETAQSEAEDSATDAEAWAVGQRGGADVPSTDETYENNAKFYAEQAASYVGAVAITEEQWQQIEAII